MPSTDVSPTDVLSTDDALALCAAARTAADDLGVPMSFAVMDPGGHLVAALRMDGAPWISATVAQGKAWTSAAYGTASHAQRVKMADLPNFSTTLATVTHGAFTPQTGAVPVYRGAVLVGAIGASGGTGDQDEAVAAAAVRALGASVEADA